MPDITIEPIAAAAGELPDGFPAPGEVTANRMLIESIIDGTATNPPHVERLALPQPTAWAPGWIESVTTFSKELSWAGAVLGGYLACVGDLLGGLVMFTLLPDGARFLTVSLETSFHHPTVHGGVRVEATVDELTGRRAVVNVLVHQGGQVTATTRAIQIIQRDESTPGPRRQRLTDTSHTGSERT